MKKHFKIPTLVVLSVLNIALLTVYVSGFRIINARAEKSSALNNELMLVEQRELALRKLSRVLSDVMFERERLESHFVSAEGPVAFIERLERLGEIVGVDLKIATVSVRPLGKESIFESLEVRFGADGEWKDLMHLIKLLEKEPLPLELTTVGLEHESGGQKVSGGGNEKSKGWHGSFAVKAIKLIK